MLQVQVSGVLLSIFPLIFFFSTLFPIVFPIFVDVVLVFFPLLNVNNCCVSFLRPLLILNTVDFVIALSHRDRITLTKRKCDKIIDLKVSFDCAILSDFIVMNHN